MKVACIQLKSSGNKKESLEHAFNFLKVAVARGADIIALPEHFSYLGKSYSKAAEKIPGETTRLFSQFAKENKVALILGSLPEKASQGNKVFNTTVVIDKRGKVIGRYRKRKLFRAKLEKTKSPGFDERKNFISGKKGLIFQLNGFRIGLAICFDIRFPELFYEYRKKKVDILFIPSAFTYKTGTDHWEPLLRSRAIEGLCYVVAPNQYGFSDANGIRYFGKSCIIDPWGNKIKQAPLKQDAILMADLSKNLLQKARQKIILH